MEDEGLSEEDGGIARSAAVLVLDTDRDEKSREGHTERRTDESL
jgi:hypothetical protein